MRRAVTLAEVLLWSALARLLLKRVRTERVFHLLDRLPRRMAPSGPPSLPPESTFRLAGACLGRSVARSQYLRTRGQPHSVVLGVRGGLANFAAHAWLDPFDIDELPSDFVELWRVER